MKLVRVIFILLLLPLFTPPFLHHFKFYLTGSNVLISITQEWHIVILSIVMFVSFLVPLSFRKKTDWSGYGLVTAFFVSLFVEMYGIPLTTLFASRFLPTVEKPVRVLQFSLLGTGFSMDIAMFYGSILMTIGTIIVAVGWITLYRNIDKGLVTKGIYKYTRNPQYLGFILVILGWFVGWPTILTWIFAPILIYKYARLSKTEQEEIRELKGYEEYSKVPLII